MNRTILAIAMAASSAFANAAPVSVSGVFNMYSPQGLDQAANIVAPPVNVDSTITGFVDQAAGTWGVASTQLFYGLNWTASGGTLIHGAGDYVLNTTTGAVSAAAPDTVGTPDGMMHFTIGANQIAGAINFAWGYNSTGIRVVNVWNINPNGGLTASLTGVPGMENGPFPGFNAAFNLTSSFFVPVPAPAAAWLLASGLLGLAGAVRRSRHVV